MNLSDLDQQQALVQLRKVRQAAIQVRRLHRDVKDRVLRRLADALMTHVSQILAANADDVAKLDPTAPSAFRDRLSLDEARVRLMRESLLQVAELDDPVGEIAETRVLPNQLLLRRVRAPLGVILMIFEARPNVITEAFSLALKAGNVVILRGGRESQGTAQILYQLIHESLQAESVDSSALWGLTTSDHALIHFLLKQKQLIDIVVPRGGEALIDFVSRESHIPIIKNDRGLCHVYIHSDADRTMAVEIVVNAKAQRPGVCNSLETILIHHKQAASLLPLLQTRLRPFQVQWFGCSQTLQILGPAADLQPAAPINWDTEYLDFKINCRVVDSFEQALEHIEQHGSRHSEAIVTTDAVTAREFQERVDAAAVYWNASTRFTDGFEFGLGGELGISTQKLHVRGPVGLRELTSTRWLIDGNGQIRK